MSKQYFLDTLYRPQKTQEVIIAPKLLERRAHLKTRWADADLGGLSPRELRRLQMLNLRQKQNG